MHKKHTNEADKIFFISDIVFRLKSMNSLRLNLDDFERKIEFKYDELVNYIAKLKVNIKIINFKAIENDKNSNLIVKDNESNIKIIKYSRTRALGN